MLITVLAIIGAIVVCGVILGVLGEAFGPDGTQDRTLQSDRKPPA